MDLSIIIVNWNSAAYVRQCLRSIAAGTGGPSREVIIVDNASYDGCAALVEQEFPGVQFIQSSENLGFARANNLGAVRARGRNLLFLNPDTEVQGDALTLLVSAIDSRPDAGGVGCLLLNTDGTVQTSCIQPYPTILNQSLNAEVVLRAASRVGAWGMGPLTGAAGQVAPVEAISGACLLVRSDVFRRVGGFSTWYFMYTEDIDLCHKMERAGCRNYCVTGAHVVHHGGGSSQQRKEGSYSDVQIRQSVLKFLTATRGPVYGGVYRAATFAVALARIGVLALASVPSLCAGKPSAARSSLFKWVHILRWSLRMEAWAR